MQRQHHGPMQAFAMSLFQACRKQHAQGNFLHSPTNASTGLFLILLGSSGETRAEIESAMKLYDLRLFASSTFEDEMKSAFSDLLEKVEQFQEERNPDAINDTFHVFRMNKLYVKNGVTFLPLFKEQTERLNAEISTIDFKGDPSRARHDINDDVEARMNRKIPCCFGPGTVDQESKIILVNGLCFTARWEYPFPVENTKVGKFHELDGTSVEVEMMQATMRLPYNEDPKVGVRFVEIPYLDNVVSMTILLPMKIDGLREMEKHLNPNVVNKLNSTKRLREVTITMPRFSLKHQLDLRSLLRGLGAKLLIGDHADLSRMTKDKTPLSLSAAVHNTYFSVNEYGTGVDPLIQSRTAIPNHESHLSIKEKNLVVEKSSLDYLKKAPVSVIVNHPFLFTVRHIKSDVMVLLGRVENWKVYINGG